MAVTIINVGTDAHNTAAPGTLDSGNFNVGAGETDRALVIGLALQDKSAVPTCNYDPPGSNTPMTLLGSIDTTGTVCKIHLFGLLNPGSGSSHHCTANWTGTTQAAISAVYMTGVDQVSLAASMIFSSSIGTQTSGPTNPPSISISSATNNLTFAFFYEDSGTPSISVTSQTSWFVDNGMTQGVAASTAAGASSNTHTFGLSGAGTYHWAIGGLNIIATGQAGIGTPLKVAARGYYPDVFLMPNEIIGY